MSKPSAPAAPDPQATISAQSAANSQSAQQTAELNRINQNTPYGSSTYSVNGSYPDGTPQYTQTTSLSPEQQNLYNLGVQGETGLGNAAVGMLGQVQNSYANPIDTSGAPGLASSVSQDGATTADAIKNAQDAAYKSQTQYLDPQYEQGQKSLDNSLINQGITQGSEAYNNAELNFGNQKQQAYQSAQNAATTAGQNEQNTLFGQGATNANLQNQSQAQYLQQLFALRNQPLNEFNALTSGSQVTNPTFTSTPQSNVATTDAAGIINSNYQNQIAAYNAQNAGINNLFSLGGTLGGAAITKYSDPRLKREVVHVGYLPSGIPTYHFKYINLIDDSERIYFGVMADEVLPIIPDAVHFDDEGFMSVDYGKLK